MARAIEIIDPEGERRASQRRKIFALACLVSLSLFGYPEAKDYYTKWQALKAGREFAIYLSTLKTRAILEKTPLEAKFHPPDEIELFKVTSCGPFAERVKLGSAKLSELYPNVEFVPEPWVREYSGLREPFLPRYCYDPAYGSSVSADGLVHGGIFLAHHNDVAGKHGDHVVQVLVEGSAGDLSVE